MVSGLYNHRILISNGIIICFLFTTIGSGIVQLPIAYSKYFITADSIKDDDDFSICSVSVGKQDLTSVKVVCAIGGYSYPLPVTIICIGY